MSTNRTTTTRDAADVLIWTGLAAMNLLDAVFRGGRYAGLSIAVALVTALIAAALIRRGPPQPAGPLFSTRVDLSTRATVGVRS